MQERYTPDIETEPLHVEVMVSVFHDQISESGKKEKEIAMLKFGNSGLRLKYIDRLDRADDLHSWEMHFTPEHQSDPPHWQKKNH